MEHTAGPWYAVSVHQSWTEICNGPQNHDRAILATVLLAGSDSAGDYSCRDANARLIAAGPDLLAACQRLVLATDGGTVWTLADAVATARAAIAKAEKGGGHVTAHSGTVGGNGVS